jgi:diguanylate cyclase (GGDEF)-like protein
MTHFHADADADADQPDQTPALPIAAIIDRLPMGLVIADAAGTVLYANQAASEGTGPAGTHAVTVGDAVYTVTTSSIRAPREPELTELLRRALVDDLTGLPNKISVEETVAALIAADSAAAFALAFIDIDNFKHINDYYGHAIGDGLLERVARRLGDTLRPKDVLARVGGDEFVLMIMPAGPLAALRETIAHLSDRLSQPFFVEGYEIFSSASIGIAVHPRDGRDYRSLRVNAYSAMASSKSAAKGGFLFFDAKIGRAAAERMKVEQRLRQAIRDRHLCCAYQPKVDFRADTVVGVEVLLRWRDEEGVIRPPGDCINLAVDLGLMDAITLMVLDETTKSIDWINDAFGPATSISLNIAARQASDEAFMGAVARAILDTGHPRRFLLEVTEEAFLSAGPFQTRVLPMLREIGIRVSIDDFGTGFSSLSVLSEITADELKVDRSFITDIHRRPRNQAILKVIETLGADLGMSIIVEGVETIEELAYLKAATGLRYAQGYYFARPMTLQPPRPREDLGLARGLASARGLTPTRARASARGGD